MRLKFFLEGSNLTSRSHEFCDRSIFFYTYSHMTIGIYSLFYVVTKHLHLEDL